MVAAQDIAERAAIDEWQSHLCDNRSELAVALARSKQRLAPIGRFNDVAAADPGTTHAVERSRAVVRVDDQDPRSWGQRRALVEPRAP